MNNNDIELIITSIKDISGKRRLISVNYEPAFALYIGEIKKYHISEGKTISKEIYETITMELLPKRAVKRAMGLLQSKDYGENELRNKLSQAYYPETAIETALNYVKKFGYIDDERVVSNYVCYNSSGKSRRKIEQFLDNKGFDRNLVERICDDYYSDNSNKELDIIVGQMTKKCMKYDELHYEDKQKLMNYFYRKGFNIDIVKKALDIVVEQVYNN